MDAPEMLGQAIEVCELMQIELVTLVAVSGIMYMLTAMKIIVTTIMMVACAGGLATVYAEHKQTESERLETRYRCKWCNLSASIPDRYTQCAARETGLKHDWEVEYRNSPLPK